MFIYTNFGQKSLYKNTSCALLKWKKQKGLDAFGGRPDERRK